MRRNSAFMAQLRKTIFARRKAETWTHHRVTVQRSTPLSFVRYRAGYLHLRRCVYTPCRLRWRAANQLQHQSSQQWRHARAQKQAPTLTQTNKQLNLFKNSLTVLSVQIVSNYLLHFLFSFFFKYRIFKTTWTQTRRWTPLSLQHPFKKFIKWAVCWWQAFHLSLSPPLSITPSV